MNFLISSSNNASLDKLQLIKLVVYSLLLVNFVLYIRNDWQIAAFTMRNGGSLIDWTRSFATTIDESAWIILIALFELETYALSDQALSRKKVLLMHGVRFICYGFLTHSLYAYGISVYHLSGAAPILEISNLCQLQDAEISFARNLLYTDLSASNCASLSNASQFFYIDPTVFTTVTDTPGLLVELQLAWADLLEVVVWLLILFTIEAMVSLQARKIIAGALISALNVSKVLLYCLLGGVIAYWLYAGHYMFAWDEFVWIAGFVLIEMNVVDWRQEIIEVDEASNPQVDT